jgi:hypothetical protein
MLIEKRLAKDLFHNIALLRVMQLLYFDSFVCLVDVQVDRYHHCLLEKH